MFHQNTEVYSAGIRFSESVLAGVAATPACVPH